MSENSIFLLKSIDIFTHIQKIILHLPENYNSNVMKKCLLLVICLSISMITTAQHFAGFTNRTTLYETYQPADVTLYSGKVIHQKQANIFLRNGRLLYKNGIHDMEANMKQIKAVKFADKYFVSIDTTLALVVDTIADRQILCTTFIDLEAYSNLKKNERIISNFHMEWDMVSAASIELPNEDFQYPLMNSYYVRINEELVPIQERPLRRLLPKNKRSRFDFLLKQPDFNWTDRNSLQLILVLFND